MPTPSDTALPDLTGLRVLCVDDFRDAADSLADVLELLDADVRACHDGLTALDEAGRFFPHAAVLDIHMPGVDGCELAQRLRSRLAGRPLFVIALTGVSDRAAKERTSMAGFDLHMSKGTPTEELIAVLAEYAARLRQEGA